jgi:hypothetical protein
MNEHEKIIRLKERYRLYKVREWEFSELAETVRKELKEDYGVDLHE